MRWMKLAQENLTGKLILEVGSGRGDSTRQLAWLVKRYPDAKLVATDLFDTFFPELQAEFQKENLNAQFVRTDACQLEGIEPESVDYLVCNYTLCAVNAQETGAALALQRFYEVLQPDGWLLVEEEYPIRHAANPRQEVWAEKWRILRAAQFLTGGTPFSEIAPEALEALCRSRGFHEIHWSAETASFEGSALDFFDKRLGQLVELLPTEQLRIGFGELAAQLKEKARLAGGFEVPYYRLEARK